MSDWLDTPSESCQTPDRGFRFDMSQPRRIDAKHVGTPISKKKERKNEPSYRFEIELRESTTDYFPEISFADLVEDSKKSEALLDPGDVNMKEVEAIAKRMEEKYGGGSKRRSYFEDFFDLAEGYDENDSFIDNTEVYDEFVPSYLTTKLGGFYINSGSLDFKEVSYSASADGNGDDSSSELHCGRNRRRCTKTMSDDDDELTGKKKKTRRLRVAAEDAEGDEGRQKKHLTGNSVLSGRRRKQKNKIMVEGELEKSISEDLARKYDLVIDDVIKRFMHDDSLSEETRVNGQGGNKATSEPSASTAQLAGTSTPGNLPPGSSAESSTFFEGTVPKELPKLPDSLSDSFRNQLEELRKLAECSSDGQQLPSEVVRHMVLRLAVDSGPLSVSDREAVYPYLASFLPVPAKPENLMKEIEMFKLKEEACELHTTLERINQAIGQAMPSLMDKYQSDSAANAQARLESKIMVDGELEKSISENVARTYDLAIDGVMNCYMQNDSTSENLRVNIQGGNRATSEPSASKAQSAGTTTTGNLLPGSSAESSPFFEGTVPKEFPKLPDNLSDSFRNQLEHLRKLAERSSDGQQFFSEDAIRTVRGLALDSRSLPLSDRRAVRTYLACFLPVNSETVRKRFETFRLKEEAWILNASLGRLKQAVEQAMPSLMDKYQCDSAAAAQAESQEADAAAVDKVESATLRDDDDRLGEVPQLSENGPDKAIRNSAIKNTFPWTEQLRLLLCAVVQLKMTMYLSTQTEGQTAEDYLKEFFNKDVKKLWPKGWMQTRVLYNESRTAHSSWTSQPLTKLKKPGDSSIAKAVGNASVPHLQRAEPEKPLTGSSSTATGGASATSMPRRIFDEIDDDGDDGNAEDSESEAGSKSGELPPKENDSQDRSADADACQQPEVPSVDHQ